MLALLPDIFYYALNDFFLEFFFSLGPLSHPLCSCAFVGTNLAFVGKTVSDSTWAQLPVRTSVRKSPTNPKTTPTKAKLLQQEPTSYISYRFNNLAEPICCKTNCLKATQFKLYPKTDLISTVLDFVLLSV